MTTVHMITDQGVIGLDGNSKEDAKVWLCFSLLSPGVQNVFPHFRTYHHFKQDFFLCIFKSPTYKLLSHHKP